MRHQRPHLESREEHKPGPTTPPAFFERALSIRQPYAGLIAGGWRCLDNRSWKTPYRGWVAIHASSSRQWLSAASLAELDCEHGTATATATPACQTVGAIIGIAELYEVADLDDAADIDPAAADWLGYSEYVFFFRNPRLFARPLHCHGKLNLWRLSEELRTAVEEAMGCKTR